jgi:predicted transcriptional regulator
MKYRSRTEITAMILDTANMETTKTKIMYNAYLSYNQLKEYISILIENNLLEYIEGSRTFRTTEKGLNFLKMYREMTELLQNTVKKD